MDSPYPADYPPPLPYPEFLSVKREKREMSATSIQQRRTKWLADMAAAATAVSKGGTMATKKESSPSSNVTPTSIWSLTSITKKIPFHKLKTVKNEVLQGVLNYEEKRASWTSSDPNIIIGQYVGAIPVLGSNWLIIEEVRFETDVELKDRLEKYGGEDDPKRNTARLFVKFKGLWEVYESLGVDTKAAVKLWYSVPVFWLDDLKQYVGKGDIFNKLGELLLIYCYDLTTIELEPTETKSESTGKVYKNDRILVLGKGLLLREPKAERFIKPLEASSYLKEMFPYIPQSVYEAITGSGKKRKAIISQQTQQQPASKRHCPLNLTDEEIQETESEVNEALFAAESGCGVSDVV